MSIKHEQKCEQNQQITTIRTSKESHRYWKKNIFKTSHKVLGII